MNDANRRRSRSPLVDPTAPGRSSTVRRLIEIRNLNRVGLTPRRSSPTQWAAQYCRGWRFCVVS
jgi:hypothetical protein